jgi:DNA mismatch repair protein MutS
MDDKETTPIRRQYLDLKARYPDTILFFRLGDFYETFDEDAETAARELDLVLTSRPVSKGERIPMAGVPYHAVEGYIARLIEKGYRVAIAEQVGEPTSRGPMERRIERVVTAGTITEPTMLDEKRPNYLAAVVIDGKRAGVAYAEISTGEFATAQLEEDGDHVGGILNAVRQELARLQPREVLVPKVGSWKDRDPDQPVTRQEDVLVGSVAKNITPWPGYRFEETAARQTLLEHFGVRTLQGFGCEGKPLAIRAAGAVLAYLQETQQGLLPQITGLRTYATDRFMGIDASTQRNLEITETLRGEKQGSLLGVIDATSTPMGGRLLRTRLAQPLLDIAELEARLDQVQGFVDDGILRAQVRQTLKHIPDLERMTTRVLAGRASPRDLTGIRATLETVPELREKLAEANQRMGESANGFMALLDGLEPLPEIAGLIADAIVDEPPAQVSAGGLIRRGFSAELDGILLATKDARDWIAGLENKERNRTGIKNLKVGYNKVFGYYLEVTKSNVSLVPDHYIRKQTLVNSERYITPELKEYESLVLNAEERIAELETRLFREICERIAARAQALLGTAQALARIDVAAALADIAARQHYVRPTFEVTPVLAIEGGRHPVVEQAQRDPFIPNDLAMDEQSRIHIITGPNMAGKCLTADTIIFTDKGVVPISALCANPDSPDTFTPIQIRVYGLDGSTTATHFYNGGVVPVFHVTTGMGYEITGTAEHRLWVRHPDGTEGWTTFEKLTTADYVTLKPGADLWGTTDDLDISPNHVYSAIRYPFPDHITPDFAYFLGLLIGDGCLTLKKAVRLTTADDYIAKEFCRIAKTCFNYEPGSTGKQGTTARDYRITSVDIRQFLLQVGLGYSHSYEKEVPPIILQAPREIVVAFLQGLFDTDGYADRRYGSIEFSTTSPHLARQVQLLLLNLGIVTSLDKKKTTARMSYRVSAYGADAIAFYKQVGFRLPRKQARSDLTSDVRHPNVGGIPYLETTLKLIQERIVKTTDKPVALKKVKSINSIFYTYIPNKRNVSHNKLQELADYCRENGVPCPEIDLILHRRYFYDTVASIEPQDPQQVYDLSVPDGHAYVAAGFVSHNSVFLRQNALIILMAQIGSFVPAERAHIGVVDRIFTRIGASDELAAGQSTFMVEMVETANILNHATPLSLLILDEVGRGTSTYDGMAIAWAVVEYLHNHPERRARTLFATHYHELIEMEEHLPHVRNFNLAVAEEGHDVVFLHKVAPGGADRSYGIHVARLAGIPAPVVHRAEGLLEELESGEFRPGTQTQEPELFQPMLIAQEPPVVEALRQIDVNSLTPLDALTKLYELQKQVEEKGGKKRKK